jgi:hypothetical protein
MKSLCAFCHDIPERVSNRVTEIQKNGGLFIDDPFAPYICTVNDLSAPVEDIQAMIPNVPRQFVHPTYKVISVWVAENFKSERSHFADYDTKVDLVNYVRDAIEEHEWKDSLVYFHHTLSETRTLKNQGWHAHVSVAHGQRLRLTNNVRFTHDILWANYVILSAGFKWLLKVIEQGADPKRSVHLSKFSELPYPLKDVYKDIRGLRPLRSYYDGFGEKIICLQLLILSTACIPERLLRSKKGYNWNVYMWNRLATWLHQWNHKQTVFHRWACAGKVYLHPLWTMVGDVEGDEFPEWEVMTLDKVREIQLSLDPDLVELSTNED